MRASPPASSVLVLAMPNGGLMVSLTTAAAPFLPLAGGVEFRLMREEATALRDRLAELLGDAPLPAGHQRLADFATDAIRDADAVSPTAKLNINAGAIVDDALHRHGGPCVEAYADVLNGYISAPPGGRDALFLAMAWKALGEGGAKPIPNELLGDAPPPNYGQGNFAAGVADALDAQVGRYRLSDGTCVETIDLALPNEAGDYFRDHPCGAQFVEVIATVDDMVLVSVVTRLHDNREARTEPLRLPFTVAGLLAQALSRATTRSAASSDQSREQHAPEHSGLRNLPEGFSGGSQ